MGSVRRVVGMWSGIPVRSLTSKTVVKHSAIEKASVGREQVADNKPAVKCLLVSHRFGASVEQRSDVEIKRNLRKLVEQYNLAALLKPTSISAPYPVNCPVQRTQLRAARSRVHGAVREHKSRVRHPAPSPP